ncbi:hypothetical protein TrispH2_003786 [Trichoplax sp. H2]|uniref:Expressed protein n=1 Tax=Trichoplax adhaerens TaxID=10228 RepID=B3RV50_TRIAD|nr:expressed protein [Trichoplax adhaerens]EDV25438.1 expressed protein [Trichoplax adhaerens]RDD44118.1 hypothetical protein TrispH2_003786 [Trichoplax sp. H2]|eukprot:XP_002111471.1 expressed protein [Trichoplax adhaerens]
MAARLYAVITLAVVLSAIHITTASDFIIFNDASTSSAINCGDDYAMAGAFWSKCQHYASFDDCVFKRRKRNIIDTWRNGRNSLNERNDLDSALEAKTFLRHTRPHKRSGILLAVKSQCCQGSTGTVQCSESNMEQMCTSSYKDDTYAEALAIGCNFLAQNMF